MLIQAVARVLSRSTWQCLHTPHGPSQRRSGTEPSTTIMATLAVAMSAPRSPVIHHQQRCCVVTLLRSAECMTCAEMRNHVRVPRLDSVVVSTPRHARKRCTCEAAKLHHDLQCSDSHTTSATSNIAPTMMVKVVGRNRRRRGCERCRHDGWAQPRATCAMEWPLRRRTVAVVQARCGRPDTTSPDGSDGKV